MRDDLFEYLEPEEVEGHGVVIRRHEKVYLPRLLEELRQEYDDYVDWAQSSHHDSPIPHLHVPFAPLDKNVDIPLEK